MNLALPARARTALASLIVALLVVLGMSLTPTAAKAAPGDIQTGSLSWGISSYLNAGSPGRPGPLAASYVAPATFDATSRLSTWGTPTGSIQSDGSASLAFTGTSVLFAPTGGGWMRLTDVEATLDATGNGTLSALVSYGTSPGAYPNIVYSATETPVRGPERVTLMTLAGNTAGATVANNKATWSGLAGSWDAAFTTYLNGDAAAATPIPAWVYASTVSSVSPRTPLPVSISLNLEAPPVYDAAEYDLGTATWGISSYLNAGSPGRPGPYSAGYVAPSTFDTTSRLSTWGDGVGTVSADGSADIAYKGTSVLFAPTGGGWLRLTDLQAELNAKGNGTVSAIVSYGTSPGSYPNISYDAAQTPARGPERVNLVTLSGNNAYPTQGGSAIAWNDLAGSWSDDFTTYLAGNGSTIAAWSYATTVTSVSPRTPLTFDFGLAIEPDPTYTATDYDLGTTDWGISTYLNAGSPGRPGPLASGYIAPASFDAASRLSTWGHGSGSVATNGDASLAYKGTSVVFAPTGGGWMRLADVEADLDVDGNGSVSALVSYGTATGTYPNITYDAGQTPVRGPERVTIVDLSGNDVNPVQGADTISWSGVAGSWSSDFTSFLAGNGSDIAAWSYASTISAVSPRTPLEFDFDLAVEADPTYNAAEYDLGTSAWGISTYLSAGSMGRPGPLASGYVAPATFDAATKLSTWGNGSGSIATDGDADIAFEGTSVLFAPTGGGWLRISDVEADLDVDGNGSVYATVAYGTSPGAYPNITYDPAQTPTRGPERVKIVALSGNDVNPVQGADSISWTGVSGAWSSDFTGFLAGNGSSIAAWTYASTVSSVTGREPLPFTFSLGTAPAVTPTVTLAASPKTSIIVGSKVTLTATVAPAAAGTIAFRSGGATLGTVTLNGSGKASLVLDKLAVAEYSFNAVFTPADPDDFTAATSNSIAFAVDKAVAVSQAGSLSWGVKASLRSYVLGGGSISTSSGAGSNGGTFLFPQASNSFDHSAGIGTSNYSGRVSFDYPAHGFSIALSNPRVAITSASSGVLITDVTYNGTTRSGVTFANLSFGAGNKKTVGSTTTFSNVTASLTASGAGSFAGFYTAGDALDPLSFVVGKASSGYTSTTALGDEEEWEAPLTPPSTEGIEIESTEITSGDKITISASGFQPNEENVRVVVYSSPVVLADDVKADAAGVVSWSGILPSNLTGEHTLTFQGSVNRGVVLQIAEGVVTTTATSCPVSDASLTWGFKESFRSYISGSIANGEWTVTDGATYDVPDFGWAAGTGSYDSTTSAGLIGFTGAIEFTGHEGALDTTVSNPQIRFVDENTAVVLLDISGETQDGAAVDQTAIDFVELDLSAATVTTEDGTVTITDAPATLTAAGESAFGTYEAGEAFDAVSVTFSTPECAAPVVTDEPEAEVTTADDDSSFPWLWIIIGLVVLAVIITVVILVVRRRNNAAA